MVLVSATIHVVALALAIAVPYSRRDNSPKPVSYTVDLVAPDRLGGTNIPGRVKPPQPKAAAAPPPPPAAAPEVPAPKPPEPVKLVQPEPKKEPPPVAAKPEVPPPPKPVAKPKEAEKPPVKVSAKKVEKAKPAPAEQKAEPAKEKAAAKKPDTATPNEAKATSAETLQQQREAIAAKLRDERLAAAVQRAQTRVEENQDATGNGTGDGSLPASYGPGEGAGGVLKGLDWIMYKNRVETLIRENWAWTGADRALEATVTFGITESGEVVNFRVDRSSGDLTYDASIERAIKGVSPLPPPPEAYREEFSRYELTFNAEFLQM